MASPPSYTATADPRRDRLPPYKASHGFANSQEELAALKEFAESKMYVEPGSHGMLPDLRGGAGGLQSLAWGGPMGSRNPYWEVGWPAPESKEERKRRKEQEKQRKKEEKERDRDKDGSERRGSVAERLMRVISRGSSKDGDTVIS
ncbi:uncharacterized protein Z520_00254 [Fonsecaea multimorphosa CBS 102226]|uniref:Uncharacterized protein n=1 Tax=Fonsecaea multimorphosa CBS 102226 TaxID=1442371 RepID=A0A0D2KBU3_9EURO|nr:uncharacterized protein Z520_00254 [Fonsecaea multimorphosa CBS 102226]KIY03563.1 hypothetical protein Z520_00254 [Fonsecaea multimorphosa CBS 102226]OAL32265.1 hypothetical protein AYO22_00287 [Fonsecaea multimorphosa]